ncbi:MAG: hypothetical protein RLZZ507_547 [Cyanobacteriota bacterium]|jgi:sigma-B regulation protein RsbU (phosphoserine phosphatase)
MHNLSIFRFKSITHRLIFSCVAAAIAIYGVSYWHARQLMYKTVGTWLIDLSQSRIDTVANEIEGKLQAIERSILLSTKSFNNQNCHFYKLDCRHHISCCQIRIVTTTIPVVGNCFYV